MERSDVFAGAALDFVLQAQDQSGEEKAHTLAEAQVLASLAVFQRLGELGNLP